MFSIRDLAIDLGTSNTLVYVRGKGIIVNEPSVLAINEVTGEIVAAGQQARRVLGKAPEFIRAVRPMVKGVIADYEVAELMLRYYLSRVGIGGFSRLLRRSRVLVAVPAYLSEVEAASLKDAVHSATASEPILLPESLTAAIGCGLPVLESTGSMVVDMGGGTTEIAIVCSGGIILAESLSEAGDRFNKVVIEFLSKEFNLTIGELTAEKIKYDLGAAFPDYAKLKSKKVRGKDIRTGRPAEIDLTSQMVTAFLQKPLEAIKGAVRHLLEKAEADMVADILKQGIVLTGGASLLPGLDDYFSDGLGVPVRRIEDPLTAVARGAGMVLEDLEKYKKVIQFAGYSFG